MKKDLIKELLQALACLLNASTSTEEIVEVIDILLDHGGKSLKKWNQYATRAKGHRISALADTKRILKLLNLVNF